MVLLILDILAGCATAFLLILSVIALRDLRKQHQLRIALRERAIIDCERSSSDTTNLEN